MHVGFIGLGAMGKPMARNLLAAGFSLAVYDIAPQAVAELADAGAFTAASPAELAARCDVIITMLPNADIVEETLRGPAGVFTGALEGRLVVDMSSVDPASSRRMAAIAAAKGIGYVDAPVSGGTAGAAGGTLTIMAGGADADVARAMPLFLVLGKNIRHLGGVGSGDAIKMVNNLLLGVNMAALAEALVLGVKSGLSAETMLTVIGESSGASYALKSKLPTFIMEGRFEPGFAVDLQYKDLELAVASAKRERLPLPVTAAAQQVYELARAEGFGRADISAIVKVWERLAGVTVRKAQGDGHGCGDA